MSVKAQVLPAVKVWIVVLDASSWESGSAVNIEAVCSTRQAADAALAVALNKPENKLRDGWIEEYEVLS